MLVTQLAVSYNSNDIVYGSRWADKIIGANNDQTFITFSGADKIDGSGGIDTLKLDSNIKDFSFSLSDTIGTEVNYLQTSLGLPPVQGPATNTYSLSWTSPNDPTVMLELVPSLEGNGSISSVLGQHELSNGNSIIVWDQHDQNAVSVHGHTGANFTYARVIDAVAGEFVSEQITLIDGTLSRAYMDKHSFVELSNGGFAFNTSQHDLQPDR